MIVATLPSGTVTLLFTAIEGSARLLHELGPEGYAGALAEHRRLVRAAFGSNGGVEVDTQGDAFSSRSRVRSGAAFEGDRGAGRGDADGSRRAPREGLRRTGVDLPARR